MATRLLKKGDLIRLEHGMNVYADVPEAAYFCNIPKSKTKKTHSVITIGNVYRQAEEFDSSVYAGEYVVDSTVKDGGNCNHQNHNPLYFGGSGDYPNGWHVFCSKKDDPKTTVDFYQTGFFTAMIPDIEPIN